MNLDTGIELYETKDDAVGILNNYSQTPEKINMMGIKNRQSFENLFTDARFAEGYIFFKEYLK